MEKMPIDTSIDVSIGASIENIHPEIIIQEHTKEVKRQITPSNINLVQTALTGFLGDKNIGLVIDHKTADNMRTILVQFPEIIADIDEHLMKILSDDVINMNDLPQIILLIKDVMNINAKDLKKMKITKKDVVNLIEKIIIILIETNVIKTDDKKESFIVALKLGMDILESTIDVDDKINCWNWNCKC